MLSLLMPPTVMEAVKSAETSSVCFAEEFRVSAGCVGGRVIFINEGSLAIAIVSAPLRLVFFFSRRPLSSTQIPNRHLDI